MFFQRSLFPVVLSFVLAPFSFVSAQRLTEQPEPSPTAAIQPFQNEISEVLRAKKYDKALTISEAMLKAAQAAKDNSGLAIAYRAQALAMIGLNKERESLGAWNASLKFRELIKDAPGQIECLTKTALIQKTTAPEETKRNLDRAIKIGLEEKLRPQAAANFLQTAAIAFYDQDCLKESQAAWSAVLAIRERIDKNSLDYANNLSNLGVVSTRQGDFTKAKEYHQQSQALRDSLAQNGIGVEASLNNLGNIQKDQNDFEGAVKLYKRAIQIGEKSNPNGIETAIALNNLGLVTKDSGDLKTAAVYFKRSLAIKRKIDPVSAETANTLNNLGVLADIQGDFAVAEKLHLEALGLRQLNSPNGLEVAGSLNNLGLVADRRGDLTIAEDYYRRALNIRERLAPESLDVAASQSGLGNVAKDKGDLLLAESYYLQGLATRKRLAQNTILVAASLEAIASVARERGDLAKAETFYNESLALRSKIAPNSPQVAISLVGLGNVARDRGDSAVSEQFYRRALIFQDQGDKDTLEMAVTYTGLGNAALEQGNFERGKALYETALELRKRLSPNSIDLATSYNNLGLLHVRTNEMDLAQKNYENALKIRERLAPNSLEVSSTLNNLGVLARYNGKFSESEAIFKRALEIETKLAPSSLYAAVSLNNLALIARERGNLEQAEQFATKAWRIVREQSRSLSGDESRLAFEESTAYYAADLQSILIARKKPEAAFAILEEGRAQSLQQLLAERRQFASAMKSPIWDRYATTIALRDRALKRASDSSAEQEKLRLKVARLQEDQSGSDLETAKSDLKESTRRHATAQDEYARARVEADQVWSELKSGLPRAFGGGADPESIRKQLPEDTLFIAFAVGERETCLYLVRRASIKTYRIEITPRKLASKVDALRSVLTNRAENSELNRTFFNDIFPVDARKTLLEAKRLLISPDNLLWKVPFAALATNDQGEPRYLGEEKPIAYTQSLALYVQSKNDRVIMKKGEKPIALVVGDPVFSRAMPKGNSEIRGDEQVSNGERGALWNGGVPPKRLPATRKEAEAIASLYGDAPLLAEDASELKVRERIEKADVLHLATHGYLHPKVPMASGLLLTYPAIDPNPGETNNDGALQAWEIFSQLHLHAEIAILSACETGLGKNVSSEGVIGLTRALQYAGCRSVLASQWKVADNSSYLLMTAFHRGLRMGLAKDEALRRAMQEIRSSPATSAPYYWAPFILTGDPENPTLGR